jgi:hypothetical protein
MGPLKIKAGPGPNGRAGVWVEFDVNDQPTFVPSEDWVGVDLDGTLSRTDNPGHFEPPYPIGDPVISMIEMIQSLKAAGVTVKIFSARACEAENIPIIQAWALKHGLGHMEVTNQKDFRLIRFYDDRAIQICLNQGVSIAAALSANKIFQAEPQRFYQS